MRDGDTMGRGRMERGRIGLIAAALAGLLALVGSLLPGVAEPPPAAAAAGDPLRERGVVTHVADGDTIDVRIDGSSASTRIRLSGIQAFEIGQCGSALATDRLRELVDGERVELRAKQASSVSDGRPIRSVHLPLASGGTADIVELLLLEGLGLWFPIVPETTDTVDYNIAATHARRLGRGIWDDERCGAGPQAGHDIGMWAKSDADSDDSDSLDDEYVRIVNRDATTLNLGGWLLRESSQFRFDPSEEGFRFPSGATVPPGGSVTVRVGAGTNTASTFYMGSPTPLLDNTDRSLGTADDPAADAGLGDGVYLQDPLGNVRSSFTWPCVIHCDTPLAGALEISHVEYDPDGVDTADNEYVEVTNVSGRRISLDGYQLRNIFVFHEFEFGTYLDPGETLRVTVGDGTPSRLRQYWQQPDAMLRNAGDRVDVVSFDDRFVDCVDWGSGRDCPWPIATPGAGTTGSLPSEPELIASAEAAPGPFDDVSAGGTHTEAIEWLAEQEITSGCGVGVFCPTQPVSRAEMATFLFRALDLAPGDGSTFADVTAGSTHEPSIGALRDEGITSGCGVGVFCPTQPVSRAELATFLFRALAN